MPSATTSAGSTEDIVDDGDDAVGTGDVKSTTTSKYIQFCVTQADLMEEMDKVKAAGAREDDPSSEIVLELIADYERREEEAKASAAEIADVDASTEQLSPGLPKMALGCQLMATLLMRIIDEKNASVEADETSKMSTTISSKLILKNESQARADEAAAELEKATTDSAQSDASDEAVVATKKKLADARDALKTYEKEYERAKTRMRNMKLMVTSVFVLIDVVKNDQEVLELSTTHGLPLNLCLFKGKGGPHAREAAELAAAGGYDMMTSLLTKQSEPTVAPTHPLSMLLVLSAYGTVTDPAAEADVKTDGDDLDVVAGDIRSIVYESAVTFVSYTDWKKSVTIYSIPDFDCTESPSETGTESSHAIDTKKESRMTKLLNSIPNEKCSAAMVLHAMIEECAAGDAAGAQATDADAIAHEQGITAANVSDVSDAAQYIDSVFAGVDDLSSSTKILGANSASLSATTTAAALSVSLSSSLPVPLTSPTSTDKPLLDVAAIEKKYESFVKHPLDVTHIENVSPLACRPHAGLLTELSAAVSATETALGPGNNAEGITLQHLLRYIGQVSAVNTLSLHAKKSGNTNNDDDGGDQRSPVGDEDSPDNLDEVDAAGVEAKDASKTGVMASYPYGESRKDILNRCYYDVLSVEKCRAQTANAADDYEHCIVTHDEVNSNHIYTYFVSGDDEDREEAFCVETVPTIRDFHVKRLAEADDTAAGKAAKAVGPSTDAESADFFDLTFQKSRVVVDRRYDYSAGGGVVLEVMNSSSKDTIKASSGEASARYRGMTVGLRKQEGDDASDLGHPMPNAVVGTTQSGCVFTFTANGGDSDMSLQCSAPNGNVIQMFSNGSVTMKNVQDVPQAAVEDISNTSAPGASSCCVVVGGIVCLHSTEKPKSHGYKVLFPDGTMAECSSALQRGSAMTTWKILFVDGVSMSMEATTLDKMSFPADVQALYHEAKRLRETTTSKLPTRLSVSTCTDPDSEATVYTREDLACFVHYMDGRTLSNWLVDGNVRISKVPEALSCVEYSDFPKVKEYTVPGGEEAATSDSMQLVSVELFPGFYAAWESISQSFVIKFDDGSLVYNKGTKVYLQATSVATSAESFGTALTPGLPPPGTVIFDVASGEIKTQDGTQAELGGAPLPIPTPTESSSLASSTESGNAGHDTGDTEAEEDGAAEGKAAVNGDSAAAADESEPEPAHDDAANLEQEEGKTDVGVDTDGTTTTTGGGETAVDQDGEHHGGVNTVSESDAAVGGESTGATSSGVDTGDAEVADDSNTVIATAPEASRVHRRHYVPPRVFFVEHDGSGVELLHANVFGTMHGSVVKDNNARPANSELKSTGLGFEKAKLSVMVDDVIGIGEDDVISYTFIDADGISKSDSNESVEQQQGAADGKNSTATSAPRRLKNRMPAGVTPRPRTATKALPALSQPSKLKRALAEKDGGCDVSSRSLGALDDDDHVIVPLPRIAAAFMQRSEMNEASDDAFVSTFGGGDGKVDVSDDVHDDIGNGEDDENDDMENSKLSTMIHREIVCFPARSNDTLAALDDACSWHAKWRQDLLDAQHSTSATSTPVKTSGSHTANADTNDEGGTVPTKKPDDIKQFGIILEDSSNKAILRQTDELQADTAYVTQKIVELRKSDKSVRSLMSSIGRDGDANVAPTESTEATNDVSSTSAADGVSTAKAHTKMTRPKLADPGPARPMAGFTLKYFDSFEYQSAPESQQQHQASEGIESAQSGAQGGVSSNVPTLSDAVSADVGATAIPSAANAQGADDAQLDDDYVDVRREDFMETEEYDRALAANGADDGASGAVVTGETGSVTHGRNTRYINIEQQTRRALHTVSANAIASRGLEQQFTLQYAPLNATSNSLSGTRHFGQSSAGDFDIGEIMQGHVGRRTMTLHNVSHEGGRFSVILPRKPLKAVYNPGIVAAGLSVPIVLELDTASLPMNSVYRQTVIVKTEMHVFHVNVVADVVERPSTRFKAATRQPREKTETTTTQPDSLRTLGIPHIESRPLSQLQPLGGGGGADDDNASPDDVTKLDPNRSLREVLGA